MITHTASTVLGISYECALCSASVRVDLPAQTISMLVELGVELAPQTLPAQHDLTVCGAHRRALSESLLNNAPARVNQFSF